jgi:F-box-like
MYLPFEVWSHIFCLLPNESPMQLMRVSQAWRDIANATPQLWTGLRICHPDQFADSAALLRRLKKSGELSLDVSLKVPLGFTELWPRLALLRDHVRRFRILNIDVPTYDMVDTILSLIAFSGDISDGNPAPLLEELRIAIDDMNAEGMPAPEELPYFEHAFYPSPRLHTLTVSSLRVPPPLSKLLSAVIALTIISGPDDIWLSVESTLDTIEAIPRLEFFKYSGYEVFSYQDTYSLDYPRVVSLPHLEMADVTVPGRGLDILQCFQAPTLRSVRLDGWRTEDYAERWNDDDYTDVSASLRRLPQRAPCIRKLDLHCIEFLRAETYNWLLNQNDFAHLEELRIEGSTITDRAFTQTSAHGPHLRRLELRGCENITGCALVAYVDARKLSGHDFRLLVSRCPGVKDEHLAQLSRLVTVEEVDG